MKGVIEGVDRSLAECHLAEWPPRFTFCGLGLTHTTSSGSWEAGGVPVYFGMKQATELGFRGVPCPVCVRGPRE